MSGPGQGYSLPWASPVQTPGEGVSLWGNMLHIYIDRYIGEAVEVGTHSHPSAQWSPLPMGPLLYSPL